MYLYNYTCVIIIDDLRDVMGWMDQPDKGFLWVYLIIECKEGNETNTNSIITNITIIILRIQTHIYMPRSRCMTR